MANRIVLEMVADANPMLKTLDNVQRNLDRFLASAESAGHSIGGTLNRALDTLANVAKGGANAAGGLAAGLAAAGAAAVSLTMAADQQIEVLDHLSQKTGIHLQTLQGWSLVMREGNLSAESVTASMRTLSGLLTEAQNPASAAAATFEQLGVSVGSLGSVESVIRAVADRFQTMADGPEKARIAIQLFGRAGLDMIPTLNRGSAAFDASRQAAERFAAVMHTQSVAAIGAAGDAMDRVSVAAGALRNHLGAIFAPAVELGAKVFAEVVGAAARVVRDMDTALDTLALRFSHFALSVTEVGAVLFSKDVLSSSAWKQAADNIRMIDQEAARLIAKRRELATMTLGVEQNAHVIEAGLAQEKLGQRILNQSLEKQRLLAAEGHAQEALGRVTIAMLDREQRDRNNLFALQMEQTEQVNNLQFHKVPEAAAKAFDDQLRAVQALVDLMPELTFHEASLLAIHNAGAAQRVLESSRTRLALLDDTAAKLSVLADTEEAYAQHAAASYHQFGSLFGDVHTARMYAFDAIDARLQASTAVLNQQLAQNLISQETYYQKLLQLDLRADAQRRGIAAQFPTFYEQQLQALVQSNAFSMAQITNSFTNATAQWIVTGRGFEQFWQQLQFTLVQAALNSIIQMAANFLLHQSLMQSAHEAMEAAKTTATAAGEAARLAIVKASNVAVSAAMITTLGAIVGIGTTALAVAQIVVTAISAVLYAAAAAAVIPGGQPLAGALIAAATILAVAGTIAITTGIAAIQAAAGAAIVAFTSAIPAMAEGGVAMGPALVGEAGPEAVIPLNRRGAAFMQEAFGGMGGGVRRLEVPVYLNGREISRAVVDDLPSAMRSYGVLT